MARGQRWRRISNVRVTPDPENGAVSFRLEPPLSQAIEFQLSATQAMVLMRALQAYQRRYHWPIPFFRMPF